MGVAFAGESSRLKIVRATLKHKEGTDAIPTASSEGQCQSPDYL